MYNAALFPDDDDELVQALVGYIYDSICDGMKWNVVLEGVAKLTRSKSAVLLYEDHEIHRANTFAAYGVAPKWLSLYNSTYGAKDPVMAIMAEVPIGTLTTSHLSTSAENFYKSPVYKEFYRPQDMYHLGGGWLIRNKQRSALLGFQRGHKKPPYEKETLDHVDSLVPHFQRALHIHREHVAVQVQRDALMSGIDSMQMGLIFFDHQAQVMYCNNSAQAIINQHPAITIRDGQVYATNSSENKRLREALSAAATAHLTDHFESTVSMGLTHPDVYTPLPVLIAPLHQTDLTIHLSKGAIAAVMMISDPERITLSTPDLLATVYNFTKTEAEIAIDLANAMSAQEIAENRGVAISTIRWHQQAIYSKMGIHQQSELIRILHNSPLAGIR
jgi:DNA-binding NarL/FixJ family response regulator